MNIKKLCGLALLLPAWALAQEKPFTIIGKAGSLNAPAKVYLDYQEGGKMVSDSAVIQNGNFSFKGTLSSPSFSRMIIDHEGKGKDSVIYGGDMLLFYQDSEDIVMSTPDSIKKAIIKGSDIDRQYQAYLMEIGGTFQQLVDSANAAFREIPASQQQDTAAINVVDRKFRLRIAAREKRQLAYAKAHPNSFFSVVALSEAAGPTINMQEIEPLYDALGSNVKQTQVALEFATRLSAAQSTGIGQAAPVFVQNDVAGKPVKLDDFKGKYVLVDFWASWCHPCRAESPYLKKAYEKFKSKGFEIVGVSLDDQRTKGAWIKAIADDGLPWIQVSDLNGWKNEVAVLYGVRAVPQNYLIDPEGKIVAKNLRGDEVEPQLARFLD